MNINLERPSNSFEFESLCQKIWKYKYGCDFDKNGVQGSKQNGVDAFGYMDGYIGVQCKLKDGNAKTKITENEIKKEVEKAKTFKPGLKKLYIATSSRRNVKIQEKVRLMNIENIENNLFEIYIKFWEDIEELINDYGLKDYYLNNSIKKDFNIIVSVNKSLLKFTKYEDNLNKNNLNSFDNLKIINKYISEEFLKKNIIITLDNNGKCIKKFKFKFKFILKNDSYKIENSNRDIIQIDHLKFETHLINTLLEGSSFEINIEIRPLLNIIKDNISLKWELIGQEGFIDGGEINLNIETDIRQINTIEEYIKNSHTPQINYKLF